MENEYSGLCVDCQKIDTTAKDDGQWLCSRCSNDRYYKDLREGRREEIRIRWADYRPGFKAYLLRHLEINKLNPKKNGNTKRT